MIKLCWSLSGNSPLETFFLNHGLRCFNLHFSLYSHLIDLHCNGNSILYWNLYIAYFWLIYTHPLPQRLCIWWCFGNNIIIKNLPEPLIKSRAIYQSKTVAAVKWFESLLIFSCKQFNGNCLQLIISMVLWNLGDQQSNFNSLLPYLSVLIIMMILMPRPGGQFPHAEVPYYSKTRLIGWLIIWLRETLDLCFLFVFCFTMVQDVLTRRHFCLYLAWMMGQMQRQITGTSCISRISRWDITDEHITQLQ